MASLSVGQYVVLIPYIDLFGFAFFEKKKFFLNGVHWLLFLIVIICNILCLIDCIDDLLKLLHDFFLIESFILS